MSRPYPNLLPEQIRTKNFTNQELNYIINKFGGNVILTTFGDVFTIVEKMYKYESKEKFFQDFDCLKHDHLEEFVATMWLLIQIKKQQSNTDPLDEVKLNK